MLNHVCLCGRLTADPELRTVTDGTAVTSVTLASDRDGRSADGEKKTDFLDAEAWGKTAEFLCAHFRRGDEMTVEGSLRVDGYTASDGTNRRKVKIRIERIHFGRRAKGNAERGEPMPF